ncbi:hypothetical protein [Methylomagnum sp.]
MAHVHGAAAAAKTAGAHAAHAHHAAHAAHGASNMGAMMEHAGHMLASAPKHAATGAVVGAATVAATTQSGKSLMSILARHPLLIFSAGIAVGYLAHKYRKEIIENATRATEKGKDFVLQQRENLEDLVAECKDCAEGSHEADLADDAPGAA